MKPGFSRIKHRFFISLLFFLIGSAQAENYIAFTNANVITMLDDKVLSDQTVLVSGSRIHAVGRDIALPKKTTIIDASNKYLLPGLAEMHGHTPVPGGNAAAPFVKDMMFLYVANGVTTVRGMLGAPGQLELREKIEAGKLIGPTLFLAGPSFSGYSISSESQAIAKVEELVNQGWDLLKVHPGLSRSQYDAMADTAYRFGIRFGGHVPKDVGLIHAISMGQHTFDHIDGYLQQLNFPQQALDLQQLDSLVQLSRDAGVWRGC